MVLESQDDGTRRTIKPELFHHCVVDDSNTVDSNIDDSINDDSDTNDDQTDSNSDGLDATDQTPPESSDQGTPNQGSSDQGSPEQGSTDQDTSDQGTSADDNSSQGTSDENTQPETEFSNPPSDCSVQVESPTQLELRDTTIGSVFDGSNSPFSITVFCYINGVEIREMRLNYDDVKLISRK